MFCFMIFLNVFSVCADFDTKFILWLPTNNVLKQDIFVDALYFIK